MPGLIDLLVTVLLPALIAGSALLFAARRDPERPWRFWGATAFALGYVIAHLYITRELPGFWGKRQLSFQHKLAWFVILTWGLCSVHARLPSRPFGMFFLPIGIVSLLMLWAQPGDGPWLIVSTVVMLVAWSLMDRLAMRTSAVALCAGLVVAGTGIAISALLSHTASVAQLTGATCASLGGAAAAGWIVPRFKLPTGAVAIVMVVFAGALIQGALYDMPLSCIGACVVAILTPWIAALPKLEQLSPRKLAFVVAAVSAVPAAIAVWLAYVAAQSTSSSYY
jgi:hypothetical protein